MNRKFKTVDYAAILKEPVALSECVPDGHLARFVVEAIGQLDMSAFYARYGERGGEAIAPEVLVGILIYGYASGVFSSRKLERATYESLPFRYVSGGLQPDHDTLANFRKTFGSEIQGLFVQILVLAQIQGVLKFGNLSLDGTKIHADASKSKAVSYKRAVELEAELKQEVAELMKLSERAESGDMSLPANLNIAAELTFRHDRLANLVEAKQVMEARAKERDEAESAAYAARLAERAQRAEDSGKRPRGSQPKPPTPGPRDKDQYNFTDPDSRIMKNSKDGGFDQDYNAQIAVTQDSLLIVANALSNHPNDSAEAIPTLDAIPAELGKPTASAMDCGYFTPATLIAMQQRNIEPYIATGRQTHHQDWKSQLVQPAAPPPAAASERVKMAYKLKTDIGQAIYRLRKSTVEPVIGILKEVLGFRQFSLRGLIAAAAEWSLVCLAYNFKRLHTLLAVKFA
jgi:transposase